MPVCILPWTTETEILPTLLDDVFSQFEQFERAASSIPLPAQTERKARTAPGGNPETVTDEESKLSFLVNVSEFKPDELTVSIDGRTLKASKSLLQRWTPPEDVDVDQIQSTLTENGQMSIEVVPKPKPFATARTIPIRTAVDWP
ncbi:Hsp20/alpha crystallin family protein [Ostertagia ostertagi]